MDGLVRWTLTLSWIIVINIYTSFWSHFLWLHNFYRYKAQCILMNPMVSHELLVRHIPHVDEMYNYCSKLDLSQPKGISKTAAQDVKVRHGPALSRIYLLDSITLKLWKFIRKAVAFCSYFLHNIFKNTILLFIMSQNIWLFFFFLLFRDVWAWLKLGSGTRRHLLIQTGGPDIPTLVP